MDPSVYGDLPRKYRETADAVVLELGDDADPRLVRRLAQECFDAIGYYAPAGEGYPDGDVTVCLTIEHDIRLDLEKADAHGAA
jgi:hypothetical protein